MPKRRIQNKEDKETEKVEINLWPYTQEEGITVYLYLVLH